MSRKPLTLTVSTPIRVEDLLAAFCGTQTETELSKQLSPLRHHEWQGKRVVVTIAEHQPTEQDYLNAAIRDGLLRATPDAEHPYTWNTDVVSKAWVSVFVERVCVRLDYKQPWRWAMKMFGLNNLSQINNNEKNSHRYETVASQVKGLLDKA